MAFPIMNAFAYPLKRRNPFGRLDLEKIGSLRFGPCDPRRYPALGLCIAAGKAGGTVPAYMNAANEVAVETFLKKRILFTDIVKVVERSLERHRADGDPDIESIFEADREARKTTQNIVDKEM